MKTPMTRRGAELLREELHRLKTIERPANSQAIGEARAHGDLSENAEYHAARERAGFIEGRISELEAKLANAQVIDPKLVDADGRCVFGATVDVEDEAGEKSTWQIVGEDEADIKEGKVSISSNNCSPAAADTPAAGSSSNKTLGLPASANATSSKRCRP